MAELHETAKTMTPLEAAMINMPFDVGCWSRAWAQLAQGLIAAEIAQLDLARSLYGVAAADFTQGVPVGNAQSVARQYLDVTHGQFETALHGYRRIGDDLARTLFDVANTFVEGWASEVSPAEPKAVQSGPSRKAN